MLKQWLAWLGTQLLSLSAHSGLVKVIDLDQYKMLIVVNERMSPEQVERMRAELQRWMSGDKRVGVLNAPVTQIVFARMETNNG